MAPPQPKKPKKKAKGKDGEPSGPPKDSAEYVTGGEFGRHFQGVRSAPAYSALINLQPA